MSFHTTFQDLRRFLGRVRQRLGLTQAQIEKTVRLNFTSLRPEQAEALAVLMRNTVVGAFHRRPNTPRTRDAKAAGKV
jgi:hypothetical protein